MNRAASKHQFPVSLRATAPLLAAVSIWWSGLAVAWAASAEAAAPGENTPNGGSGATQSEPSSGGTDLGPRVGELGDLHRLSFSGAKTFSAKALRLGLQSTADFAEVSHPLAPRTEYVQAIEGKLRLGYQHLGFPEVRVGAQPDTNAGLIRVNVEEGPRYFCGPVKVVGARRALAKAIMKRLTAPSDSTAAAQDAFSFVDQAPDEASADESEPQKPGEIDASWVKGQPAHFSDYDRRWLEWQVADALRDRGLFFPEVELVIERDAAAHTAALRVEVRAEGPRRYVNQIEITGNKKNSREALLRYLDVRPRMELTRERVAEIADRLWQAARFLDFHVTVGAPDAAKRVGLRIAVVEYGPAPPVDREFSPLQQAMLKSRQWLAKLDKRREDLVAEVSGYPTASTGLAWILSPRGEVAVFEKGTPAHSPQEGPGGFILKPGSVGLYSPARARKWVLPCRGVQLITFISATSSAGSEGAPFNLTFGTGWNSGDEAAKVPSCLELKLSPVVFVRLADMKDSACWFDRGLVICSNAASVLKSDARTGRILELSARGREKWDVEFQLRFQRGTYRRQAKLIERAGTSLANAYRTNAPLSSSLGFLTEETLCSDLLPPLLGTNVSVGTWEHLPGLLHALRLADLLLPLEQLRGSEGMLAEDQEAFVVPERQAKESSSLAWLAVWLLPFADQMLPAQSWPGTLTREAALAVQGTTQYTAPALEHIYAAADTGPLGYWAAAQLLAQAHQPALAATFSARGLERLSTADFRRDCRVLWDDKSILGQCLGNFATALRDVREEDWRGVAGSLPPYVAAFLQDAARCSREAKGQSSREALAPALDALWENGLRQEVAAALRELNKGVPPHQ